VHQCRPIPVFQWNADRPTQVGFVLVCFAVPNVCLSVCLAICLSVSCLSYFIPLLGYVYKVHTSYTVPVGICQRPVPCCPSSWSLFTVVCVQLALHYCIKLNAHKSYMLADTSYRLQYTTGMTTKSDGGGQQSTS